MSSQPGDLATQVLDHPTIGSLRGIKKSPSVTQYLGVPYATLEDAFARAQPTTRAADGKVIDATRHGPIVINPTNVCEREQGLIQAQLPFAPFTQSATKGLTLNISLPANVKQGDGLPVVAFIHGGGFANGSANLPQYDLARLTELSVEQNSPIIAIGVNHRVGIPGFLTSEEMKTLGYKANNGLDDQRTALRWIQSHISGFGGNPNKVTYLGQSAGSVAGNIHLELAEPLFQQYISMAGTAFSRPRRPEAMQKAYAGLTTQLGVAESSPQEQIKRILEEAEAGSLGAQARKFNLGPTLDGDLVPEALVFRNQVQPDAALKTFPGLRYCKRVLVGDCQFDGMAFLSRVEGRTDILPKTLAENLKAQLDPVDPKLAPAVISGYGLDETASANSPATTRAVLNVGNDIHFALPALAVAKIWSSSTVEGTKAFLYHFNCPNPWDGPLKGEASHILDIAFALQNYKEQLSPGQRLCAERFASDIIRFVNGEDVWEDYHPSARPTSMIYSAPAEGGKDESHLVQDSSAESTGRREVVQKLGAEPIWDKILHSWQAFSMHEANN